MTIDIELDLLKINLKQRDSEISDSDYNRLVSTFDNEICYQDEFLSVAA